MAEEPETRLGGCGPEETAGWARRETLGERPPGRGGRAGGEGPEESAAWMRNKAAGQARAPHVRPAGGLRADPPGEGRERPAGPLPAGRRVGGPWEALSPGLGSAGARGRDCVLPVFADRSCPAPHPPQVGQHPSRSSWRKRPGCPPACPTSPRSARPPALRRSWAAPGGPGDECPRLCSGCEQDAVARDPGTQTLMRLPWPPCALFSDSRPQADASQVSPEPGSALMTSLENIWHERPECLCFGCHWEGYRCGLQMNLYTKADKNSTNWNWVEYTLIQPNLLHL